MPFPSSSIQGRLGTPHRASLSALVLSSCLGLALLTAQWYVAQPVAPLSPPLIVVQPPPLDDSFSVPLPPGIDLDQDHRTIASHLVDKEPFLALALSVESSPKTAYVDAAGANVGAGYCIEKRRKNLGDSLVRQELHRAGFSEEEVTKLMSRQKKLVEEVSVTSEQTLKLLVLTKPQYEKMAKDAVGSDLFDQLKDHQKSVLAYLAYNVGVLTKFKKLIKALHQGDDVQILSEMAPRFRLGRKEIINHRLRAWAQATWVGTDQLKAALEQPVQFEKTYAHQKGQRQFILEHQDLLSTPTSSLSAPPQNASNSLTQRLHDRRARKNAPEVTPPRSDSSRSYRA